MATLQEIMPVIATQIGSITADQIVTLLGAQTITGAKTFTNINIDGGTIDSTIIGGTTPAAATVTDLVVEDYMYMDSTAAAIYMDLDSGYQHYLKRITCNDGTGNFNLRLGHKPIEVGGVWNDYSVIPSGGNIGPSQIRLGGETTPSPDNGYVLVQTATNITSNGQLVDWTTGPGLFVDAANTKVQVRETGGTWKNVATEDYANTVGVTRGNGNSSITVNSGINENWVDLATVTITPRYTTYSNLMCTFVGTMRNIKSFTTEPIGRLRIWDVTAGVQRGTTMNFSTMYDASYPGTSYYQGASAGAFWPISGSGSRSIKLQGTSSTADYVVFSGAFFVTETATA